MTYRSKLVLACLVLLSMTLAGAGFSFWSASQFQHQGHDVVWARTGSEGLALARDASVDLIVLDLFLPGMRGTRVCRSCATNDC